MNILKEGSILEGEVIATRPFGAFIKLPTGHTGLVHISQLADKYVKKVEDVLKVGKKIKVKVLSLKDGKVSLSLKSLSSSASLTEKKEPKFVRKVREKVVSSSFEDMMKKWMRSSEERLSALSAKHKKLK